MSSVLQRAKPGQASMQTQHLLPKMSLVQGLFYADFLKFIYLFSFLAAQWQMELPGQESDPSCSNADLWPTVPGQRLNLCPSSPKMPLILFSCCSIAETPMFWLFIFWLFPIYPSVYFKCKVSSKSLSLSESSIWHTVTTQQVTRVTFKEGNSIEVKQKTTSFFPLCFPAPWR